MQKGKKEAGKEEGGSKGHPGGAALYPRVHPQVGSRSRQQAAGINEIADLFIY